MEYTFQLWNSPYSIEIPVRILLSFKLYDMELLLDSIPWMKIF